MSSAIKRVKDLPLWFSLDKYSELDTKSPDWWHHHLNLRRSRSYEVERMIDIQTAAAWAESIWFSDPIATHERLFIADQLGPINSIGLHEAFEMGQMSGEILKRQTNAGYIIHQFDDDDNIDLFDDDFSSYIRMDLNSSDKALIHAFKKHLNKIRSVKRKPKPHGTAISEVDIKKLSEYKVLPLIDLLQWEQIARVTIDRVEMIEALFPDGEDDAVKQFQKTKNFAKKSMSTSFLTELANMSTNT